MTKRRVALIVAAVLVLVVAAWAVSRVLTRLTGVGPEADPIIAERSSPSTAIRHISATLFSGSKDGETLVPHQQEVVLAEGIVPQGREILLAQLERPTPPLVAVLFPNSTAH